MTLIDGKTKVPWETAGQISPSELPEVAPETHPAPWNSSHRGNGHFDVVAANGEYVAHVYVWDNADAEMLQTRLKQVNGEDRPTIVKTAGVCGGRARVDGTRISVWHLETLWRFGMDDEDVLDCYPSLTAQHLTDARAYATAHPDEIAKDIADNDLEGDL